MRVSKLKLIGPKEIVEQALEVLADFESATPDLRAELDAKGIITFLYAPSIKRNSSAGKFYLVGNEDISWGKSGLLAHMVWTALRLRANLQNPSVSFRDTYAGGKLMSGVYARMIDWLMAHRQPVELIESYLAAGAKHDAWQARSYRRKNIAR